MTDTLLAGIIGALAVLAAALIDKFGFPGYGKTIKLKVGGEAEGIPLPSVSAELTRDAPPYYTYYVEGILNIRQKKARFKGTLETRLPTNAVGTARFTGTGAFMNGVVFLEYHVDDSERNLNWIGVAVLRLPVAGPLSGYWLTEDTFVKGKFVFGRLSLPRINQLKHSL